MKKKLILGSLILVALAFILLPHPASDLIIRIYFDDIEGDFCALYYSMDPDKNFSAEQLLYSEIDHAQKSVEFRLDSSWEDQVTALRLDLPHHTDQLICVKNISVSSGGVIQKEYDPCHFFADINVVSTHETTISLVQSKNRAYLLTGTDDPYLVLSDSLVTEIQSHYSHTVFSRIFLCLFIAGSYIFAKKKLFT